MNEFSNLHVRLKYTSLLHTAVLYLDGKIEHALKVDKEI